MHLEGFDMISGLIFVLFCIYKVKSLLNARIAGEQNQMHVPVAAEDVGHEHIRGEGYVVRADARGENAGLMAASTDQEVRVECSVRLESGGKRVENSILDEIERIQLERQQQRAKEKGKAKISL